MKRVVDVILASLGLVLLAPLFFVVAVWIKLSGGPGPVLFVQERTGQGGRPFRMLKFRTMRVAAPGLAITVAGDQRITRVGQILRQTKLDELPQLWNVLVGDMSFVGPRPEVAKYTSLYSAEQARMLALKPGITDPASFAFFDESEILSRQSDPEKFYIDVLMAEKIRINLEYAARRSLWSDLYLIVATVLKPLGCKLDVFTKLELKVPEGL